MNSAFPPLVSIVTPSRNSADFLEAAITSVQHQDYPNIEHIIVDGNSSDNTLDILRAAGGNVSWVSEPDNGQADALNKGFAMARGNIIGWLNADDTYQPGAVRSAVSYLLAHPHIDLVYGNYNFIDARGQHLHTHIAPEFSLEKLLYAAIIPQTAMFFRRGIIDEFGGVEPTLHYVLDWEFTFRIARRYNIANIRQTLGNFRVVEGTKSVQQPERFWPELIPVLEQVIAEETPRLEPWAKDARFMAHLLAGLEFARGNDMPAAQRYVKQAFAINPKPAGHPAVLASGLYRTAEHPWHSAFRRHPLARQALDNISLCLTDNPVKLDILGQLNLCRAFRSIRQGKWAEMYGYMSQSGHLTKRESFYNWRTARMMLGAMVKS